MLFQSVKMAWKSIASNKMRSFLTMLGIIIGVLSLVVLVSLVNGATTTVTDEINSLGSNLLTVSISDNKGKPMKLEDVNALMDENEIALTAPGATLNLTGKYGGESDSVMVTGTTAAYSEIQGLALKYGRFLKSTDVDNVNYVAVVNETLAEDMVGYTSCVGEKIHLNGMTFTIIGVLDEENSSSLTSLAGDQMMAYIPYTTAIRVSNNVGTEVTSFYAAAADENSMEAAEAALKALMMARFNEDEDAFTITNRSEIMDALSSVTGTLSLLLGGIAAISLLVGGIGIMNIMLVSVTERTREIGIRKAIGAGRGTIMLQFLVEALTISLIGCVIGIGCSWIILMAVNVIGDASFGLNGTVVVISMLFSLGIGVIFGMYPANKAATMLPIDALRFEG